MHRSTASKANWVLGEETYGGELVVFESRIDLIKYDW